MTERMNTKELLGRLRRHYMKPGPLPGGIFVPECGWNGVGGSSRCDALYVGFTSTSGRRLIGHELKVSRADWRHELDKAGKSDAWHDQCHAWYVVAPSTDIVPVEEVPPGWGLMVVNPRTTTRLEVKVKPTLHLDRSPSWDAVRSIMARQDTLRAQAIAEAKADVERREREVESAKRELQRAGERSLSREDRERLDMVKQLEASFGIELKAWWSAGDGDDKASPEQLGAALRLVRAASTAAPFQDRYAVSAIERTANGLLEHLAEYADAVDMLRRLSGANA